MQPLKVGVTPIGRKYELRLAEIAWRTTPTSTYMRLCAAIIYIARDCPMNETGVLFSFFCLEVYVDSGARLAKTL